MGYRGKLVEQNKARDLRAWGATLQEIAAELGVSKSSASLWVRDVEIAVPRAPKARARTRGPNILQRRKQAEIEELLAIGRLRIGSLSDRDLLIAGTALYAGEGAKGGGSVTFANSSATMIALHCRWLRRFFDIDEERLRVRLYLHEGLGLDSANRFWSEVTGIPLEQFCTPYRAIPDPSIRKNKHENGCATVRYSCSRTHRTVMGLVNALLSSEPADIPG